MQNCESLVWFGVLVLVLTGGFALLPFLCGKTELVSAWNILLLGVAIFLGIGCIEAAYSPMRFRGLHWFEPSKAEVKWFLTASTLFLVTLFAAYRYDPISRRLAAGRLTKWPPISTPMMLFVIVICLALAAASQVNALLGITFVGKALINISHKAFVFSVLFSFVLWYRQRTNVVWLGLFITIFLSACVLAIVASGGRRLLLSVLIAPVLVIYFYHARHWRPTKTLAVIGAGVFVIFILNLMYSSIRHFDRRGEGAQRSAANVIAQLEHVGSVAWYDQFASDALFHFSQQVVHYSLITDRFIEMDLMKPKTLNTLKFLVTYPIPRAMWYGKPRPLGGNIGVEVIPHFSRNQGIRWGCGVAGQAVYEGGLWVVVIYTWLAVLGVRFIDEPLRRDPTNPFLIGILASASAHIVGWPRGDLGVMSIEIIECFVFAYVLGFVCRMLFGTERTYQRAGTAMTATRPYSYPVPLRR